MYELQFALTKQDTGFPHGSMGKESTCNARDTGNARSIPGGGNGNSLQYSCLENPMDRRALWATVCGFAEESDTT